MLSPPDGHASQQQVSSVQKGEFGVKYPVKQEGGDALTYTWTDFRWNSFTDLQIWSNQIYYTVYSSVLLNKSSKAHIHVYSEYLFFFNLFYFVLQGHTKSKLAQVLCSGRSLKDNMGRIRFMNRA